MILQNRIYGAGAVCSRKEKEGMKIAITGSQGFLGSRLTEYLQSESMKKKGIEVCAYNHRTMDFTCRKQTETVLAQERPDILIHTAAISDIGECEKNPELSESVNVAGVKNLADLCAQYGIRLIFCSSDQVYMGSLVTVPHREDEEGLTPPTLYGRQKLKGEQYIRSVCTDYVILRLSWMFADDYQGRKEHGNLLSELKDMVENGQVRNYPAFDFRSITDVWEVVANMEAIWSAPSGIYNFGSENDLSTYDLIAEFLRQAGISDRLPGKDTLSFAGTPRNLRMDMEKCRKLGIVFRSSGEALAESGRRK